MHFAERTAHERKHSFAMATSAGNVLSISKRVHHFQGFIQHSKGSRSQSTSKKKTSSLLWDPKTLVRLQLLRLYCTTCVALSKLLSELYSIHGCQFPFWTSKGKWSSKFESCGLRRMLKKPSTPKGHHKSR